MIAFSSSSGTTTMQLLKNKHEAREELFGVNEMGEVIV
jgi:hypothetical protein